MTKKKTKRKLEKLRTKNKMEWNLIDIRYENHEKKKKSQTVVKDTKPKD